MALEANWHRTDFHRGNLAQLGLAIARTFAPDPYSTSGFQLPDIQALVSLLSFLVGASLGRFENLFGGGRRKQWLVTATFAQTLMAMAAALTHHYSSDSGVAVCVLPFVSQTGRRLIGVDFVIARRGALHWVWSLSVSSRPLWVCR